MNSLEIIIEALERHGSKVRRHSTAIVAQCPSHKDNTPSLALKHADDRTLLNCFAGCDTNVILETIGLTIKDSFDEPIETMAPVVNMADYLLKQIQTDEPTIENKPIPNVTEYVYHNEQWEPFAKTIKIVTPDGKKTFRQHRYDNGQWEPGLNGLTPPLYELPAVIDAINEGLPIYVCEGEKDADTINNIEVLQAVATTAPMGAGKWRQQHTEQLTGAKLVYIIHDNDEPGINHAINVQTQLNDHNIPTIILTPKTGKDATDHINAGHGINDFIDANQQIQDAKNEHQQKQLQKAIDEERIKQTARDTVRKEITETNAANRYQLPTYTHTLTEELQQPDEQTHYIIDQLWPTGANISLTATYKAGKSSTILNVIKSLTDHTPLFEHFQTNHNGRIAYLNYEVAANQMRRWFKDVNITNTDNIQLINMRGHTWPLLSDYVIKHTIDLLATNNITTLILDPLARAFVGSGDENSNQDVGIFLDTLDYIKDQAGVANLLIAAHTGRNAEQGNSRARGASRFDDWVDARWMLTKDADGQRWFSADGRDVTLDESKLEWVEQGRRQIFHAGQGKKEISSGTIKDKIMEIFAEHPDGISSKNELERLCKAKYKEGFGLSKKYDETELRQLVDDGRIRQTNLGYFATETDPQGTFTQPIANN